jgi:hypothetical protein
MEDVESRILPQINVRKVILFNLFYSCEKNTSVETSTIPVTFHVPKTKQKLLNRSLISNVI